MGIQFVVPNLVKKDHLQRGLKDYEMRWLQVWLERLRQKQEMWQRTNGFLEVELNYHVFITFQETETQSTNMERNMWGTKCIV